MQFGNPFISSIWGFHGVSYKIILVLHGAHIGPYYGLWFSATPHDYNLIHG